MKSVFDPATQHEHIDYKIIAGLDRISQALRYLMWENGKKHGFTPIQMQCLIFLRFHDEARNRTGVLAREFDVTPTTISQAIKTLTAKGYVERKPLPDDARIQTLRLTPAGEKACAHIDGWANGLLTHLDAFSAQERENAFQFILQLIASLQRAGVISTSRQCTTCRFFRPDGKPDSTFYCKLLERRLESTELRLDCPEHELPE